MKTMQRVAPSDGRSKLRTVVAVKTIPSRPYKIYVEVRRTDKRKKYALTIASRDERKMIRVADALTKRGYKYNMYRDAYGFTRVHVRNLRYNDLSYIIVMLKFWAREAEENDEEDRAVQAS